MRSEMIQRVLEEFVVNAAEVEGAAVTSMDGLTIAAHLPQGMDEDRVGAMTAAMLSLGERTAEELQRGSLEQVLVRGTGGFILTVQAGPEAVLTALVRQNAKLGLVFLDIKRAASKIAELL